jgi:hypothetical protein
MPTDDVYANDYGQGLAELFRELFFGIAPALTRARRGPWINQNAVIARAERSQGPGCNAAPDQSTQQPR